MPDSTIQVFADDFTVSGGYDGYDSDAFLNCPGCDWEAEVNGETLAGLIKLARGHVRGSHRA